jgi:hypothetical protein
MAAGLGFKDFATGEVLTAADVDGYLMQGVWVFASATARDAAVTSPQEGNFAYLKDTNVTTYYTGSAWANLDTTGMTNPMTTTGDTIYSSSGSTPARLGIGTAGQVLQVNSGATAPEWATPAGGLTYSDWTPSYTNLTIGNGTVVSRYAQSGKYVNFFWSLQFGSTTSISGSPVITLPVTARNAYENTTANFDDAGTGGFTGYALMTSTTAMTVYYIGAATAYTQFFGITSSLPFTWTTNDRISFQISYEAA